MVFPCEILPSLCSSLSTSNLSEIMKNVHVFLIKAANSLMSSHPGLPTNNVWWIDSNSYSQEGMSSKTRMEHWCIQFSICHYSLYTLWFVGHPIFQLESILMTITLNQTTRGQTLWRSVHLETDITTCSHIELEWQFCFQWHTLWFVTQEQSVVLPDRKCLQV